VRLVQRALELPDALTYRAAHLGESLRSENQQRDHDQEHNMRWLQQSGTHADLLVRDDGR
jgi:hypothetical protein